MKTMLVMIAVLTAYPVDREPWADSISAWVVRNHILSGNTCRDRFRKGNR